MTGIRQLPLFVYGTLRPGQVNFMRYLDGRIAEVHPASIQGRLYLYEPGGYPFLRPGPGVVHGEALHIMQHCWETVIAEIDRLEDYRRDDENAGWYLRREVQARLVSGATAACWTYYWNRSETGPLIPGGDWIFQGQVYAIDRMETVNCVDLTPSRRKGRSRMHGGGLSAVRWLLFQANFRNSISK